MARLRGLISSNRRLRAASLALVAALLLTACDPPREASDTPNLVLVISDDHGYPDFGFMGSPYVKTPNLDRVARQGLLFTNGFVTASVCRPSLRSLLTGLHPYQWDVRVEGLRRRGVELAEGEWIQRFETLPRLLAERGYRSFQAGKLWEASYELAGFTDGMVSGGRPHAQCKPGALGRESLTPVFDFVDAQPGQPFFLWFAPCLPHRPHDAPAKYTESYSDLDLSEPARAYYANISRFDERVGELMTFLESRVRSRQTLVVFLSDNGWDQGPHAVHSDVVGDGPKGKKSFYELGFRTPLIAHWPGRIPAGAVRDEIVSSVDLFPTFLDYAGAPLPANRPGHSLRPLLEGRGGWPREELIGGRDAWDSPARRVHGIPPTPGAYFLRNREWRYLFFVHSRREELYDMRADPREEHNVAKENPELARRFRNRILAWRKAMAEPFE